MNSITVDLRMIHASGIGTYLKNIIPLIIVAFPKINFNLLGKKEELTQFSWAKGDNINLIDLRSPIYSFTEQIELLLKIPYNTSLFWSPHYNIPLFYRGKLLVTVHDVFHLQMLGSNAAIYKKYYAKVMFNAVRHKASAIQCVSDFTKKELVRLTGKGDHNIFTTYNGVNPSWFNIEKIQNPRQKPYILFIGNVKPHKNLSRLVEAFQMILNKVPHDLVIVGKKEGFITGDSQVLIEADNVVGDRVHFTGYIDDKLLSQYLVHADTLVFPSLYEGFGLPPLEAMACGCPVIVSNTSALPEVCGDAALYCDPYNIEDIAEKVLQILTDNGVRELLRHKGLQRAQYFTWERCVRKTTAVIEEVLSQ